MESDITICNNCSDNVTGKFCCNCGNPTQVARVDFHYVLHEVQHVLHFEKGFLYTLKELLFRPGQNIKEFIKGNRARLVKPIIFITIASLLYATVDHFFHILEKHLGEEQQLNSLTTHQITDWVQNHYGYANIIEGFFIALWIKLFFKKYGYNVFEVLILLCFVIGMGMLISSVLILTEGLFKINLFAFSNIVGIIYGSWAIGQFFDKRKPMSYVKSLIAYLLGMFTFSMLILIIGVSIDYFFRH
jgi:hypothetical protein